MCGAANGLLTGNWFLYLVFGLKLGISSSLGPQPGPGQRGRHEFEYPLWLNLSDTHWLLLKYEIIFRIHTEILQSRLGF